MKKSMKLVNKLILIIISLLLIPSFQSKSEDKITSTPLINLDNIKPSFEDVENEKDDITTKNELKNKKKILQQGKLQATLIGLDKITAKSSKIMIKLNETKNFGPLEIKILKCGKIKNDNKTDDVAYMQVKDLTKNENEKVFIFNGWTFASDPALAPFDHAIYDLQLLSCNA